MSLATGVGSMPGDDQHAYDEAVRVVLGELPDLPHLPEVPGRGATATMTGRGLAVLADLGADLQPAGWRLTGGGAGVDHRRARSLLVQDLDTFEENAQGLVGGVKIQIAGPWTLAATVEKPRGDKVLADHGARADLAQALAEGLRQHIRDVRRRVPGLARLVVQVDEPALPAVLGGRIPTASGFGRHRTVHPPEASAHLAWVFEAIEGEGAVGWAHSCAPGTPLDLLRGAGARGLAVDYDQLTAADHDHLAEALEAGDEVALGIVPTLAPNAAGGPAALSDTVTTERTLRWLEMLGLDPGEVGERLVISSGCGLAGATPTWARQALVVARSTAANLG